jgi:hypothetical protein
MYDKLIGAHLHQDFLFNNLILNLLLYLPFVCLLPLLCPLFRALFEVPMTVHVRHFGVSVCDLPTNVPLVCLCDLDLNHFPNESRRGLPCESAVCLLVKNHLGVGLGMSQELRELITAIVGGV